MYGYKSTTSLSSLIARETCQESMTLFEDWSISQGLIWGFLD